MKLEKNAMQPVAKSAAKDFAPASAEASQAAAAFIEAQNGWAAKMQEAENALRRFVQENVGEARGFLSKDRLNMSVYGIVFDKAPAAGFLAVPSAIAEDLRAQGLRGDGYFPDTNHPVGRQALALMNQLSRAAEQRPLLAGVPGVDSYGLEGSRVVLSRATKNADGALVIKAAPSAVRPTAAVTPLLAKEAVATAAAETSSRSTRTMRM
jgi:hypothetical protein